MGARTDGWGEGLGKWLELEGYMIYDDMNPFLNHPVLNPQIPSEIRMRIPSKICRSLACHHKKPSRHVSLIHVYIYTYSLIV